jgi:hypothetical protein
VLAVGNLAPFLCSPMATCDFPANRESKHGQMGTG